MKFYEKMKEVRMDADETQAQIADELGITRQQYHLYETGKRHIPIDLFIKFCEHYNTSSDYILGLGKDMKWPK